MQLMTKGSVHVSIGALGIALILLVIYVFIAMASPETADSIRSNVQGLVTAVKP